MILILLLINQKKIYLSKVSISEAELAQLMDEETFIDSAGAIEMGFATDVANNESDKPAQCARNLIYQALTDEEKPTSPTDEPGIEIEDPEDDESKESEDDADKKLMILRPLVKNQKMKPTAKLIRMTDLTAMMVLVPIVPMIRKLAKRMSQIQAILTISKIVAKAKIQTTKKMMKFRNSTQTFFAMIN